MGERGRENGKRSCARLRVWEWGLGLGGWDWGSWFEGLGFVVWGLGLGFEGLGFGVCGFCSGNEGLGFGSEGLGFGVGSGLGVWGRGATGWRGMPATVSSWYLKVMTVPTLGGSRRWASEKPVPTCQVKSVSV